MSSRNRSVARKARRAPPATHQEVALLMVEATSQAELREVFDAIKAIHLRHCFECRTQGAMHMLAETLPW